MHTWPLLSIQCVFWNAGREWNPNNSCSSAKREKGHGNAVSCSSIRHHASQSFWPEDCTTSSCKTAATCCQVCLRGSACVFGHKFACAYFLCHRKCAQFSVLQKTWAASDLLLSATCIFDEGLHVIQDFACV